ncbi:AbaSI family restriction endonuclease [Pedobacter agri]|uniref:AbaSI family restriction endonuclease n=1 Tax=Pedobacter agri TaxID=454586 RepID=UPI002931645E|nr:hypothetical protein [Pedobacter agri]
MKTFKHEYLLQQVNKLKSKKHEIAIVTPLLYDSDLQIVQPYAQYPVKNYYIDLYYPKLNLAIEVDEPHHSRQIGSDLERQLEIEKTLNCEFIRVCTENTYDYFETINAIKEVILSKVQILTSKNQFTPWSPVFFDMQTAQKDWPNSIFYKIREQEKIPSSELFRKPLQISADKLSKADYLVGIYGNTVTDVFNANEKDWVSTKTGHRNVGKTLPQHPMILSGTTIWNVTSNKVYGNNLK